MGHPFPVRTLVDLNGRAHPLDARLALEVLPDDPGGDGPSLRYGPYLAALAEFLTRDAGAPLRSALAVCPGRAVPSEAIEKLDITSVKHGAFYHVACARVRVAGADFSFAVNAAVRPEQQAILENEYHLLEELLRTTGLPYLPRPCLLGETIYRDRQNPSLGLRLSVLEWFEDFHEFHLSMRDADTPPEVKVWTPADSNLFLDAGRTELLYGNAAAILTAYFDMKTYKQVYPWHHAAGDFVVRLSGTELDVRLIAARDYRCLASFGSGPEDRWIPIIHFFLNLTLRMRLDRLDGTGEPAWADAAILNGVIGGFLRAWEEKVKEVPGVPSAGEIIEVLRSFDREEWLALGSVVIPQGMIERREIPFLEKHLAAHASELASTLSGGGFDRPAARIRIHSQDCRQG